ncbi:MAG: hypothetical protein HY556_01695 [Euryarchaeota archaeon]|nr:hypothetical protein [Euryarchaeota archaeon]
MTIIIAQAAGPALASHRYTYLADAEQGHTFEPDHEVTSRIVTPAGDPVEDATIDADGDAEGDLGATGTDVGGGNRLLDSVVQYMTTQGGSYVAVNGYSRSIIGGSSSFLLPGSSGLMAWYGEFNDVDGDSRIDDLCEEDPRHGNGAADEFLWRGGASGEAGRFNLVAWIVPGNHSDELGDRPDVYLIPDIVVPDGTEAGTKVQGFDGAYNMHPDFKLDDRSAGASNGGSHPEWPTGCPGNTGWVGGTGFGSNHADDALVRETAVVVAVFEEGAGREPLIEQGYDVSQATFVDVDRYSSLHPSVDSLYTGFAAVGRDAIRQADENATREATPALKDVRDSVPPLENDDTAEANARFFPLAEHEPNDPADRYGCFDPSTPCNATFGGDPFNGTCATDSLSEPRGSCNDYSGYASDWHAWLDVQAYSSGCICGTFIGGVYGPAKIGANLPSGETGRHSERTFTPGQLYDFYGHVGQWSDKNGDTWIGRVPDVLEPYSKGFADAGKNEDPNQYTDNDPSSPESEFRGNCVRTQLPGLPKVTLVPLTADGSWPGGVLRFNNFERVGLAALSGRQTVELYLTGPIEIPLECVTGEETTTGQLLARDYVSFLGAGIQYGVTVTTTVESYVTHSNGDTSVEIVRDVDVYGVV